MHIPFTTGTRTGIPNLMSLNVHMGISIGCKDDLESLMYTMVYPFCRTLPLEKCLAATPRELNQRILEKKLQCSPELLFADMVTQVRKYYNYVRNLKHSECPCYCQLRNILVEGLCAA